MPSTATITTSDITDFVPLTVIKSAVMDAMFAVWRGHLIAVDPSTSTAAAVQTYDVGSSDHRWRYLYGTLAPSVVSTTGAMTIAITHDVVLMNCTAQTNTGSLPTAVGHVGLLTVKNIGTGGFSAFLDGSGSEKIDNTITVNLVDGESTTLVSDNANWWSI